MRACDAVGTVAIGIYLNYALYGPADGAKSWEVRVLASCQWRRKPLHTTHVLHSRVPAAPVLFRAPEQVLALASVVLLGTATVAHVLLALLDARRQSLLASTPPPAGAQAPSRANGGTAPPISSAGGGAQGSGAWVPQPAQQHAVTIPEDAQAGVRRASPDSGGKQGLKLQPSLGGARTYDSFNSVSSAAAPQGPKQPGLRGQGSWH